MTDPLVESAHRFPARFVFVCLLAAGALVAPANVFGANEVLFETPGGPYSRFWGPGTGTYNTAVAVEYTPSANQQVCVVKHKVGRSSETTDNIVLTVYVGGTNPQNGVMLAQKIAENSSLPTNASTYVPFEFDPCLTLASGGTYFFTFTRAGAPYIPPYIGFHSNYEGWDQASQSVYWQNEGFAFVGGAGWRRYPNLEWSFRLEGPTAKEPVILIPGILGSELKRISDDFEVWPNAKAIKESSSDEHLNDLSIFEGLPSIIEVRDVVRSSILEILGFDVESVYLKNIIQSFTDDGYVEGRDLFVAPYDWRFDLSEEIIELEEKFNEAIEESPTGKVNIIAHSMGGLLAREYLRQNSANAEDINELIFVGTPHLGSPKAFKILNYGDNMGFQFGNKDFLNPGRIKIISQNMPAVYELLPGNKYFEEVGGYVRDFSSSIYPMNLADTNAFMTSNPLDGRNSDLLNRSKEFHSSLDDFSVKGPKIFNVVSCKNPKTIGSISVYTNGKIDYIPIDGDGTVPTESAISFGEGASNYFVSYEETEIDHTGLIRDARVISLIKDFLTESAPLLADGISTDRNALCSESSTSKTLVISTHSPVELHIYDDQNGQHMGPDATDESIDLQIPGSDFFMLGENSFAIVPDGNYRIVVDAIGEGSFDLKAKVYDGITLEQITTFLDVSIESDLLQAEMNLGSQALMLQIDNDGDGVFEENLSPTSELLGLESADVTPPTVQIISPEPRDYIRSAVINLNIAANDQELGVAFTNVALDGEEFSEAVIDLFFQSLGVHTISASAYDNAGNPSSETQVEFRVVTTLESALSDIERSYSLGWITKRGIKESLGAKLRAAFRVQSRRRAFEEIMNSILRELDKEYQRGRITDEGYNIIKEDVEWLSNFNE